MTKPFDLEAAKAGAAVQTRDGCTARIICFDRNDKYSLVVLIMHTDGLEYVYTTNDSGLVFYDAVDDKDLIMAQIKTTWWFARSTETSNRGSIYQTALYPTKDKLLQTLNIHTTYTIHSVELEE